MSLQVEVLEKSFDEIKPQADEFVASFYDNLFTAHPEARPLFDTTDMQAQKKKLLNSLVLVVENLRNPDVLGGALKGLGARHVKYGALPEHYPLVGGALLTTFEQYLQDKWTPQVKQAWVDAYGAISEIMLDGADYSEAEIALPTPESRSPSPTEPSSASSNTQIAFDPQPLASTTANSAGTSIAMESESNYDSSKATMAAFAGGGIMAIVATILVLLL